MKKIVATIAICFSCLPMLEAQNYSTTFGRLTQYEADMTEYENDRDAEAVVLYDMGEAAFRQDANGGFALYINRKTKIKILKQAGLKQADFEIPLYENDGRHEELSIVQAITYNYENGILTKTLLDAKNIFQEKANNHVFLKKFSMPDVREGSIIEIEYNIISPFFFNLTEWRFQRRIPTVYSLFTLLSVPYYEYQYIVKGITKFDEYSREVLNRELSFHGQKYQEVEYKMGMRNIAAFRDEEFISSPNDYLLGINFQLSKVYYFNGTSKEIMTTWSKMCNDFIKDDYFGKYISAAEKETKKIVQLLSLDGKAVGEKIETITKYVKNNFSWNGTITKYAIEKPSKVIKNKTGNSAELNLLLLAALKNAGIDVKPVLASTRGHGIINTGYPFQQFFDYALVMAQDGEKQIFLDATEPMLTYNELPPRCINIKGLLVYKNSEQWADIVQDELSTTEKEFKIKCSSDLSSVVSEASYTAHSYDAFFYRKKYNGEQQRLKDYFAGKEIEIKGNIDVESYDESEKPFVFSFQTETPLTKIDNKLFISPFLHHAPATNMYKQDKRILPVDMLYRDGATYTARIEIPAGYKVELLPKAVNHNSKIATVKYAAEQKDNFIHITAHYETAKSIYDAREYPVLKATYAEIVRIFNEKIILVKAGE